ncbi:hypothetical protein [Inhella gelatinilytica]|uniref:MSHA biogenesis protein MshI n=1 Tax=Inhella gelatinilytica TaxID=2795030 RepID=A0A931ISS5_9BURK|nr:hypothetical protein [Inhella gelatinilytica]MBH9551337.1 hypothetical protein [Inhella gelatinilytica]
MAFLRTRTEPGWTALSPQGPVLRAVHVAPAAPGGRPRVQWVWEGPWGETDEAQREALQALRRQHSAPSQRVWVLERGQYQIVPTDAPADVPESDWAQALRWQLKGQLEFSAEDATIDLLRIPQEAGSRRSTPLLAVLAPRNRLRPLVMAAESASQAFRVIDIPETALRNWTVRAEASVRARALLSFGSGQGGLVITHEGQLLSFRQIELAAELLEHTDLDRRQAALDRAALEVQRTLDHFDRQFSHLSLGQLDVAPGPASEALLMHLAVQVATPVTALDPVERVDLSGVPALQGTALAPWLLPIGAALRGG